MSEQNYCCVFKNFFYEDLYNILEDEELIMTKEQHTNKIKYKIEKLVEEYIDKNKIKVSDKFDNTEKLLEDLMLNITEEKERNDENEENEKQGNTLLMYANENEMYECVFMEIFTKQQNENELNQIGSISNIELSPIYGPIGIIKSSYKNRNEHNKLEMDVIEKNDVINLMIRNFYHKGIMIYTDKKMQEIEFAGDNPNVIIGEKFKQKNTFNIYGLVLVGYNDNDNNNGNEEINEIATKLVGEEIKGRYYITTLCPITNKRFWDINEEILTMILKLIDYETGNENEKEIIKKIQKELDDDKLINPFYIIKKYCI